MQFPEHNLSTWETPFFFTASGTQKRNAVPMKKKMRSNTGNAEILEERISQIETELASLRDENARLKEAHVECRSVEDIDAKERLRLFDVLETLPIYICLLSEDYHIPFANRYFRETFGESHGHPCYKFLFNRTEPCETCETYTVMKTRKPHHWFWTGPNRRDYDIYDFPFTDSDGTFLILEMGIDITDRNIAEKKLKQTLDTLEARVADRTRELETYYAKLQTEMGNIPKPIWHSGRPSSISIT